MTPEPTLENQRAILPSGDAVLADIWKKAGERIARGLTPEEKWWEEPKDGRK